MKNGLVIQVTTWVSHKTVTNPATIVMLSLIIDGGSHRGD